MQCSDLICPVSSHHMLDRLVTSRVIWQPRIGFEDFIVQYYNLSSICDQTLDLSTAEDSVASKPSLRHDASVLPDYDNVDIVLDTM